MTDEKGVQRKWEELVTEWKEVGRMNPALTFVEFLIVKVYLLEKQMLKVK